MPIGQKLFEEKFTPRGFAFKSEGSEGIESEDSVTGEITGFGKAQGVKGTNMGTLRGLLRRTGVATGTGLGLMTLDGDPVTWTFSYAGKVSASGEKWFCTVTFMTMSEKFSWLNQTVCVMEGESGTDPATPGTNVYYEWN